jgi:hypothetical protein
MSISLTCSHCGRTIRATESAAGRKVRCPSCQKSIDVPPLLDPAPIDLVPPELRIDETDVAPSLAGGSANVRPRSSVAVGFGMGFGLVFGVLLAFFVLVLAAGVYRQMQLNWIAETQRAAEEQALRERQEEQAAAARDIFVERRRQAAAEAKRAADEAAQRAAEQQRDAGESLDKLLKTVPLPR